MSKDERFDRFVEPDTNGGCHLWSGSIANNGYGRFGLGGTAVKAHRFAWERANGPIPRGLYVCHRCDVPACVNPAHLFLGTPQANVHDMTDKGRWSNGGSTKRLTNDERLTILKLWANDNSIMAISDAVGRSRNGVTRMLVRHGVFSQGPLR